VLYYGESLSLQLSATDLSGIASWSINDNENFEITNGLVTNRVTLALGGYNLNVTVTDNEGNSLTATFRVAVLESAGPSQPTPVDGSTLIIFALVGVVFVLMIVILLQQRRSGIRAAS
jgi:hypothetical protein